MGQQKLVKAAGLRSTRECFGVSWDADQQAFVDTEPKPLVVKPVESCGSDGVKVCYSAQEAREHFELLMQSQTKCRVLELSYRSFSRATNMLLTIVPVTAFIKPPWS